MYKWFDYLIKDEWMNGLKHITRVYIYLRKSVGFVQYRFHRPGQWHDARDVGAMTFRCFASRRSWSRSAAQRLTGDASLKHAPVIHQRWRVQACQIQLVRQVIGLVQVTTLKCIKIHWVSLTAVGFVWLMQLAC